MPDVHAVLSASGAKKWLNCPGAKALEKLFPDTTTEYAEEGTLAHALAEAKVKYELGQITKAKYAKEVKKIEESPLYSGEMEEHTEGYKEYVTEIVNYYKKSHKDVKVAVEKRIDFSDYVPEGFGTGDICIVTSNDIHIIDLKYGKGVRVEAERNPQLMLYALGALIEYECIYDIKNICMTIYQPRLDQIDSWEITSKALKEWGANIVKPKAELAFKETGECVYGPHCDEGLCKARPVCRKYNENMKEFAEKFEYTDPKLLSPEELSEVLDMGDKVSRWVRLVQNYALNQSMEGKEIPGYKLVEGRSNRKWNVEEADIIGRVVSSESLSLDEIAPRKLKSISELEKSLGKDVFKEYFEKWVIKPPGKPTLVDFSDKRPAINDPIKDFEDYIDI